MSVRLKPVEHQVIVITGASSGIGLATARLAAERGARLVLAARNGDALDEIVREIEQHGGRAVAVTADVSKEEDVRRIAHTAIQRFGGFDTWVNNAAAALYGRIEDVPVADHRQIFETNYWGVVYGSLEAAKHLRRRGGALINVGSVLSDRAINLQGPYSATKHAVKGFTDALRMEIESDRAPVSVTLIKPSSIYTPYPEHARNHMDSRGATLPPPTYDPRLVGRAILFAAENPRRDVIIGMGGYAISLLGRLFPRLTDLAMEASASAQKTDDPGRRSRADNLYEPREDHAERSSRPEGPTRTSSYFLEAQMHPFAALAIAAGVGLAAAALLRGPSYARERHARRLNPEERMRRYEGFQEMRRQRGNGHHEETVGPGLYGGARRSGPDRPRAH
jgi:NAD(P)-dependent dehydrogenase (short-subunit alcohol dehydrogenase family)